MKGRKRLPANHRGRRLRRLGSDSRLWSSAEVDEKLLKTFGRAETFVFYVM